MIELTLTAFAKARVWFYGATPGAAVSGAVSRNVKGSSTNIATLEELTLEAFVPRGGRAEYGLLGLRFVPEGTHRLRVDVPYTEGLGVPWLDSLAARVDDVRLGLPREFAVPILDAIVGFTADGFPSGGLSVVEAAHGRVGSNAHFLGGIAECALSLMLDDRRRDPKEMAALLVHRLVHA